MVSNNLCEGGCGKNKMSHFSFIWICEDCKRKLLRSKND